MLALARWREAKACQVIGNCTGVFYDPFDVNVVQQPTRPTQAIAIHKAVRHLADGPGVHVDAGDAQGVNALLCFLFCS